MTAQHTRFGGGGAHFVKNNPMRCFVSKLRSGSLLIRWGPLTGLPLAVPSA
jgi:hypothetical protein